MSDKFLVFDKAADARALSQKEAATRGCDGVHTTHWFDVRPTKAGKVAVIVPAGEDGNLKPAEKLALVDVVVFPDPIVLSAVL